MHYLRIIVSCNAVFAEFGFNPTTSDALAEPFIRDSVMAPLKAFGTVTCKTMGPVVDVTVVVIGDHAALHNAIFDLSWRHYLFAYERYKALIKYARKNRLSGVHMDIPKKAFTAAEYPVCADDKVASKHAYQYLNAAGILKGQFEVLMAEVNARAGSEVIRAVMVRIPE